MRPRTALDDLANCCRAVSTLTGIPFEHVLKDFWITEALRAMATTANDLGIHLVFKGGTSLSKGYQIIHRFSEDIDLLCVSSGGADAVHSVMRRLHAAVADHLGVAADVDAERSTRGKFRPAHYVYPGQQLMIGETAGVIRVELSTWGGALPSELKVLRSLVAEHSANVQPRLVNPPWLVSDVTDGFSITVLRPERTLVEKLVILHDAATSGDERRIRRTARHYYDIWCLLGHEHTVRQLSANGVMVLAHEVFVHNTSTKAHATHRRPSGGFAESTAFTGVGPVAARHEYTTRVVDRLIWPGAAQPTFDECLARVQECASLL
jgi:predicted nucleotidyltransferase component of viral defense system